MELLEDKNQKEDHHVIKNHYWKVNGIAVDKSYRLPVGDYVMVNEKIQDAIDRKKRRKMEVKMMDLLGTYNVSVDTKSGMAEVEQNLNGKGYERFRDELILAQNNGIQLFILIEDDGGYCDKKRTIYNKPCKSIDDVFSWKNPRLFIMVGGKQKYPRAKRGATIAKQMYTIEKEYGCRFVFCTRKEAGAKVIELLALGETDGSI